MFYWRNVKVKINKLYRAPLEVYSRSLVEIMKESSVGTVGNTNAKFELLSLMEAEQLLKI